MDKNILTIIPAAGRGSRMLSLTSNCSKSMIPVAGKPLISYLLDQLINNNLKDVTIIVGYEKESLMKYVSTFYKDKLNITFVEQKELLGLCHAIYQVMNTIDMKNYDSVFIMLGDAIFNTTKIFDFSKSYIACKIMSDYSRWCIASSKDNILIKLLDKPSIKPDVNQALVGAYYFNDASKFEKSVIDAINSGITIRNEYQISTAIEIYKEYENIHIMNIEDDEWFDFGEFDTYNINKRRFNQSRFFNNVEYHDNSITKRSKLNGNKIQKEINWFLAIPDSLKKYLPNLVNYSLDDYDPYYTLEYCSGSTLQEMWLYNNLDSEAWEKILSIVLNTLNDFKENSREKTIDFQSFVKSQILNRVNLAEFFKGSLDINGEHYDLEMLKQFFTNYLENFTNRFASAESIIVHGDMVFSNIIYDSFNNDIKLIDPRGDFCGNIMYGNVYYDLAKLAQCIIGDYDYIVNDLFTLTDDGYEIYLDKPTDFKKNLFYKIVKDYNVYDVLFLTAVQFMTMIPLHAENTNHQKMMKYKAIEILNIIDKNLRGFD